MGSATMLGATTSGSRINERGCPTDSRSEIEYATVHAATNVKDSKAPLTIVPPIANQSIC